MADDAAEYQEYQQYLNYLQSQKPASASSAIDDSFPSRLKNNLVSALNGAFPLADEGAAGLRSILPGYQDYTSELNAIRGGEKQYESQYPIQSKLSGLIGALSEGPALMPEIKALSGLPSIARSAIQGAGYGGLYGAASGEGGAENRALSGGVGAAVGGTLSPLLTALIGGAGAGVKYLQGVQDVAQPETQAGLKVAEGMDLLNKPAEDIRSSYSIGGGTEDALQRVAERSQSANLPDNIAAQLGADGGDTAADKAISEQFRKAVPELVDSGIFQKVEDVPGLVDAAGSRLKDINAERASTAAQLDSLVAPSVEGGFKNPGVGVINSQTPEIADAAQALTTRIAKLDKSTLTQPIKEGLSSTLDIIKNDINRGGGLKPSDAIDVMQNLNEARRSLAREFDTRTIAARADGNTPNLGSLEASIEAVSKLQKGISNALEGSVENLSNANGLNIPKDYFTKLNDEYGALKSVEDLGDRFTRGTRKGLSVKDPTRVVQNTSTDSPGNVFLKPGASVLGTIKDTLSKALDAPNATLKYATSVDNRNAQAIQNIQGLLSLNKTPMSAPDTPTLDKLLSALSGAQSGVVPVGVAAQTLLSGRR